MEQWFSRLACSPSFPAFFFPLSRYEPIYLLDQKGAESFLVDASGECQASVEVALPFPSLLRVKKQSRGSIKG